MRRTVAGTLVLPCDREWPRRSQTPRKPGRSRPERMTFDLGFETEARKLRGEKGQGSMARRLKVFTWSDGFHVYTLASPSRAGALRTWGLSLIHISEPTRQAEI